MTAELQRVDAGAVATVQPPAGILDVIARAASDPSVDVAKMAQLLELKERLESKEAERAFNDAMARLQPRLPRITKRGKIEFKGQSTPFAKYEDIDAAIRPLLSAEGFSISFGTAPIEKGGILVTATLAHSAGHSKTESMPLPFDTSGSKNSIQAVGSSLSYGKRYLVCAMLNIITEGEDTDGHGINRISADKVNILLDMKLAAQMNDAATATFLNLLGVAQFEEITEALYQTAYKLLQGKMRAAQKGGKQ